MTTEGTQLLIQYLLDNIPLVRPWMSSLVRPWMAENTCLACLSGSHVSAGVRRRDGTPN